MLTSSCFLLSSAPALCIDKILIFGFGLRRERRRHVGPLSSCSTTSLADVYVTSRDPCFSIQRPFSDSALLTVLILIRQQCAQLPSSYPLIVIGLEVDTVTQLW